jgi:hypothetical protein
MLLFLQEQIHHSYFSDYCCGFFSYFWEFFYSRYGFGKMEFGERGVCVCMDNTMMELGKVGAAWD